MTILGSGTSQGIPVIACPCAVCHSEDRHDRRLRSSALLEVGGKRIVIDAGPDFRYQMLRSGVEDVRAILLTHGHKDHVGGLDDVRAFNWVKQGAVDVYGNEGAKEAVYNDFSYAFAECRYPGVPEIRYHLLDGKPFYVDDIRVVPLPVMHYKMPVLGFRVGNFAYITDAKTVSDAGGGVSCSERPSQGKPPVAFQSGGGAGFYRSGKTEAGVADAYRTPDGIRGGGGAGVAGGGGIGIRRSDGGDSGGVKKEGDLFPIIGGMLYICGIFENR